MLEGQAATEGSALRRTLGRARGLLPSGRPLSPEVWQRRHRVIAGLLWINVAAVFVVGMERGVGAEHAAFEAGLVLIFAVGATTAQLGRDLRSCIAAVGLLVASGVLVHLTGGIIEMHFYFFIMVGVITLYQSWLPFLIAVAFVALHHGIIGGFSPETVYNHPAALENPWKWAAIHAAFILGMSAVSIVAWKLNEELRADIEISEERFRGHFEHAAVGEAMTTLDGRYIEVNQALCNMLGYTSDELSGLDVASVSHPDDRERTEHQIEALVAGELDSYDIEKRYVRKDGGIVHCMVSVSAIRDEGKPRYLTGVIQDITERKHAEEALEHQALHDALTGLPNRSLVVDRITQALHRSTRSQLLTAVLFLDIDRFKEVNDSLGHSAGDEILLTLAARLQRSMREGDTVARFGGDEFVVLCEGLESDSQAADRAERLLRVFDEAVVTGGREFSVTASIGVAVAPAADAITAGTLLSNADAAMYRAKDLGRHRFELFDSNMRGRAVERLETRNDLHRAIERGEFAVHYQPIVSIAHGKVTGVEALVRWHHPTRGLVPPAEFIPVAEETGLIGPLGTFVLEEACRAIAAWNRDHLEPLRLSVNLSPKQLASSDLPKIVQASLVSSGLGAGYLCLEITETALLDDVGTNVASLHALKALGVDLAVDDFGTGYSSLLYLKRFPVDVLKVDRSFTRGIGIDSQDSAIVGAVIGLAAALDVRTVAEGVETPAQLDALRELNCDAGQGYLWTGALPIEELDVWMARRPTVVPVDAENGMLAKLARRRRPSAVAG